MGEAIPSIKELKRVLSINAEEDKIMSVLYHSSYQPQDAYLRKRNKEYACWGKTIIQTAYAEYLYRNVGVLNAGQMSNSINNSTRSIIEAVYEHFSLEKYVRKSNSEQSRKHTDVVPKLMVVIYHEEGFTAVENLLLPFFENNRSNEVDYKTLLQEYAQAQKRTVNYTVLKENGPDHEKSFTIKAAVGDKYAIATAIGKRKAEKDAAKCFALKYRVSDPYKIIKKPKHIGFERVSEDRKRQLNEAMKVLGIHSRTLPYRLLDEALTHSSIVNEQKHKNLKSNELLSVLGAYVLRVICGDYIVENYDMENVSLTKEWGVLLDEENLAKSIPDNAFKYLKCARNVRTSSNRSGIDHLKNDILKSIIAVLWMDYTDRGNIKDLSYVKQFSFDRLSRAADNKILDNITFLQEVVQYHHFIVKEDTVQLENTPNHDPVFSTDIELFSPEAEWQIIAASFGRNKRASRNEASKEILSELLLYLPNNSPFFESISRRLNPEELVLFEIREKGKPLPEIILPNHQSKEDEILKVHDDVGFSQKGTDEKNRQDKPQVVSFDDENCILYIYKGTKTCIEQQHRTVPVKGILASLEGKPIIIDVHYCRDCRLYFLSYADYRYYCEIYGVLLGNYFIRQTSSGGSGYEGLAEESILKMCGYTVNQAIGLTAAQRHLILENIMVRGIISKFRIMEYLQFFINNGRYRYNMRSATKKWEEDLKWVRAYHINKQRHFLTEL